MVFCKGSIFVKVQRLKLKRSVKMFINLTNHPSDKWSESQRKAAEEYGEIVDIGFPDIDSKMSSEEVKRFAMDYVKKIMEKKPKCVLCQGEFTFSYQVIKELKARGIKTVAACSERHTSEMVAGDVTSRGSVCEFVQFRED